MKILFIGNSYTYFHTMPKTVESIARAEGLDWTVDAITKGGWYLSRFADPENEMHAPLQEKLNMAWDAVFLQDNSCGPLTDREGFITGAQKICLMMKELPTRLFMYVTWSRMDGCPMLEELGLTRPEMTAQLHAAYTEAAEKIGAQLSDVGGAFAFAHEYCPEVDLYHQDLSHPSAAGSYLAALIHFASLAGRLPERVRFLPEEVSGAAAERLLCAARQFLDERIL